MNGLRLLLGLPVLTTVLTPKVKERLIRDSIRTSRRPARSWLNVVERWFAELTNRKLRRSAHRGATELHAGVRRRIDEWNGEPKPFGWTRTADQILDTSYPPTDEPHAGCPGSPCERPFRTD